MGSNVRTERPLGVPWPEVPVAVGSPTVVPRRAGSAFWPVHVHRPELLARLAAARIAVVEAAGGAGKSTLVAELGAVSTRRTVTVGCQAAGTSSAVLVAALAAALTTEGGIAPLGPGSDEEVLEGVLYALAGAAPTLLVVDDAHHLDGPAGALLAGLAFELAEPHALVVLARRLPETAAALRGLASAQLDDADLAFGPTETIELCARYGVTLSTDDATTLTKATAGWVGASVLAAARLAESADPATEVRRIAAFPDMFVPLVDAAFSTLAPEAQDAALQFVLLPFASREVASALGRDSLLDELRTAGLPMTDVPGAWYALAGPVHDVLRPRASPDPARLVKAGEAFAKLGSPLVGARALLDAGLPAEAAQLVAALPVSAFGVTDHAELADLVAALPATALAAHPAVLLHLARAAHLVGRFHQRASALREAWAVVDVAKDPALARAVEAELLRERIREGDYEVGRARALDLLEQCDRSEIVTRAALLHAAGSASARLGDPRSAERQLIESVELYGTAGDQPGVADALIGLGYSVYCFGGEYDLAIARLEAALDVQPLPLQLRAAALSLLGETYEQAGQLDDAERVTGLAISLAAGTRDTRLAAFSYWEAARIAACRGARVATLDALVRVEGHRGDWFDQRMGAQFLADAAELCARVGDASSAREYLRRARAHPCAVEDLCTLADAAIEARYGDPARAVELLDAASAAAEPTPRVGLTIDLLRAYALLRVGDVRAGPVAASVFDRADSIGRPSLPLTVDPTVGGQLVGLAAAHGSLAAANVMMLGRHVHVRVLGECSVSIGGARAALPPGLAEQLVGCLATSRGRCPTDLVLEALWPEAEPERSRTMLRKLMSRVKTALGIELVVRDGDALAFADGTTIDAVEFETESGRALATRGDAVLGGTSIARSALSRYRDDLLPDLPYAEWTIALRERLRQRRIALLDLLATDAQRRNDVAGGLELIEELITSEPYEEHHYLRAAEMLLDVRRTGAAQDYLRRAAEVLDRLDLRPSQRHEALRVAAGMPRTTSATLRSS
jgi:DNA-binding SARP family transcriptional activator/tetratricopeptide (TPR) repeat protein